MISLLSVVFGLTHFTTSQEIKPAIIYTPDDAAGYTSQKVYIGFPICSTEEKRCSPTENNTKEFSTMKETIIKLQKEVQNIQDVIIYPKNESVGKQVMLNRGYHQENFRKVGKSNKNSLLENSHGSLIFSCITGAISMEETNKSYFFFINCTHQNIRSHSSTRKRKLLILKNP